MRLPELSQVSAEGEEGEWDQFDMLLGERDAHDGEGEYQCRQQMGQCDLPTEENQPDQVKENAKRTVRVKSFYYLLAEWGEGRDADLERLQAEWNADDREAEKQSADEVAESGDQTAENKPDDVAKRTHEGSPNGWSGFGQCATDVWYPAIG